MVVLLWWPSNVRASSSATNNFHKIQSLKKFVLRGKTLDCIEFVHDVRQGSGWVRIIEMA